MKEDPFVGVYRALSPKELAEMFMNPNDPKTQARALSPKELAEMFMNPNAPKTEAEHWAVREIEKLRAEIERLREALALGSEVLASHQGTLKREWHNVGAWLYAGDTINVVRAPLPEIAAPESAEGDR